MSEELEKEEIQEEQPKKKGFFGTPYWGWGPPKSDKTSFTTNPKD